MFFLPRTYPWRKGTSFILHIRSKRVIWRNAFTLSHRREKERKKYRKQNSWEVTDLVRSHSCSDFSPTCKDYHVKEGLPKEENSFVYQQCAWQEIENLETIRIWLKRKKSYSFKFCRSINIRQISLNSLSLHTNPAEIFEHTNKTLQLSLKQTQHWWLPTNQLQWWIQGRKPGARTRVSSLPFIQSKWCPTDEGFFFSFWIF